MKEYTNVHWESRHCWFFSRNQPFSTSVSCGSKAKFVLPSSERVLGGSIKMWPSRPQKGTLDFIPQPWITIWLQAFWWHDNPLAAHAIQRLAHGRKRMASTGRFFSSYIWCVQLSKNRNSGLERKASKWHCSCREKKTETYQALRCNSQPLGDKLFHGLCPTHDEPKCENLPKSFDVSSPVRGSSHVCHSKRLFFPVLA